jgi:hypothetical protein
MSVDISDQAKAHVKCIKLGDTTGSTPSGSDSRVSLRKDKPKNSQLPPGAHNGGKWHLTFIPSLVYWLGNSKYPWTIEEDTLSSVLEDIYHEVYNSRRGYFDTEHSFGFGVVSISFEFHCQEY